MKSFNSAPALLEALANQGCRVWMTGDNLRVRDPERRLTDDLRQAIRQHKEAILTLLELYEERAAIMEYCGGLPRDEAERQAWAWFEGEGGSMEEWGEMGDVEPVRMRRLVALSSPRRRPMLRGVC